MSLKAVFFDLDGTLLDTAPDFVKALNKLLRQQQRPPRSESDVRKVVSDGAAAMVSLGFDVNPDEQGFEQLRQQFLDAYLEDLSSGTTPYPGIEKLIETLSEKNIAWGIVTNKPWTYAEPLMKDFSFASTPSTIVCPDHVENRKPAPDALLLACEHTGCAPQEAIYIGDHRRDIECGINAGMPTIAVGYGYLHEQDSHRHWNADHTVNCASELWSIIEAYC